MLSLYIGHTNTVTVES